MNKKVRHSLKVSFWDGVFASCMMGLTTDYIAPYALALKATTSQIGILSAIPNFVSSFVQLKSADLAEKLKSRKMLFVIFVLLHLLMGIPIIFIPYIFKTHQFLFLLIFVTLFTSLNAFAAPAWAGLMAEYIPSKMRGRYFGWRNKILGIVTIISSLVAGLILQFYKIKNDILKGFLIIFSLAVISRFISWCFLTQMYEPPFRAKKEYYFSFLDFIRRFKESNFAKFVIFVAGLNFCVNLASPFFSVFMLRDLKFSYITYTIVMITVPIIQILIINRWGNIADRVGNLKIMKITSLIISSLPLWWLFCHRVAYLIIIQIFSGFAWAGFNLCAMNFIYDAVTPQKRVRCIAYFNVFNGLALCFGALGGSYLVNVLPKLFGYKILALFLVSSILRFLVVISVSHKIKEVRNIQKISDIDLLYSVVGLKEME